MGLSICVGKFSVFIFLVIFSSKKVQGQVKVFNLKHYVAAPGGKLDTTRALTKAWEDACKWKGKGAAQIFIPTGIYHLNPVVLMGPCSGPIEFRNTGLVKAPPGRTNTDRWINFEYVDRLTINGFGSFDGQGLTVWAYQGPARGRYSILPTMLSFAFVNNSKVENVSLINSKGTHFILFECNDIDINNILISSPERSPNTDGIKIGLSNGIRISDSKIASGDDCVALLTGSSNINITNIDCGPGHGFSIGSMGSSPNEQVKKILVQNCTLSRTENGLRIKTWATGYPGTVSDVTYENILIDRAYNPIIIDQNYCPPKTCPKGNSHIQIRDVKFVNIRGTSRTDSVVNLQCSGSNPCQGIELQDIDIHYQGPKRFGYSLCSHVRGKAIGVQIPKSCMS